MQAIWNANIGLKLMSFAYISYTLTFAMLALLFFPFLPLGHYVAGLPIGVALSLNILFFVICNFAKRDHGVSVSIVPQGLRFHDEADGYEREDLIRYEDIKSVQIRRNPFFKSLVIDLKENNQRFSLSNVALPDDFLARVHACINGER